MARKRSGQAAAVDQGSVSAATLRSQLALLWRFRAGWCAFLHTSHAPFPSPHADALILEFLPLGRMPARRPFFSPNSPRLIERGIDAIQGPRLASPQAVSRIRKRSTAQAFLRATIAGARVTISAIAFRLVPRCHAVSMRKATTPFPPRKLGSAAGPNTRFCLLGILDPCCRPAQSRAKSQAKLESDAGSTSANQAACSGCHILEGAVSIRQAAEANGGATPHKAPPAVSGKRHWPAFRAEAGLRAMALHHHLRVRTSLQRRVCGAG